MHGWLLISALFQEAGETGREQRKHSQTLGWHIGCTLASLGESHKQSQSAPTSLLNSHAAKLGAGVSRCSAVLEDEAKLIHFHWAVLNV